MPQLVVVSGLLQWESLDGWDFLGHNLLLSRASFFFTMGFCLSRSLSHELFLYSQWNSGYHEAFLTNFFFFLRWNSGYHEAFLTNFFFFFFLRWNSGYHEAFHTNFFFFFTMEFWLSRSLSHELFLFLRWNSGYHEAFITNFFLFPRWNFRDTRFGGRLFSYIYHKEYLHRIRLVKNLAS
jgi:hypothetical protein